MVTESVSVTDRSTKLLHCGELTEFLPDFRQYNIKYLGLCLE